MKSKLLTDFQICISVPLNFFKKRSKYRYFPEEFTKFLKTEVYESLLLFLKSVFSPSVLNQLDF